MKSTIASLRQDARAIYSAAIEAALPDSAVRDAFTGRLEPAIPAYTGDLYCIAVGKAAFRMAQAADAYLPADTKAKLCITKHGYATEALPGWEVLEASHPVSDESTYRATERALSLTAHLKENDLVILLLSGGGSALFEKPVIAPEEWEDINRELLACGANIVEINTLRKRFSSVKGGRFAEHCAPAKVHTVILSDVVGNRMDMVASGPTCPDASTSEEALAITKKYNLTLSDKAQTALLRETPKVLPNATACISGSVSILCQTALKKAGSLGYESHLICDDCDGEARETGDLFVRLAHEAYSIFLESGQKVCFILGGETVVHLKGNGLGGRNQEMALTAAIGLSDLDDHVVFFSVGSDGTDGPTDAAGGLVDPGSYSRMTAKGIEPEAYLDNNDSYHALAASGDLVFTGPTGTNVNDLACLIIG